MSSQPVNKFMQVIIWKWQLALSVFMCFWELQKYGEYFSINYWLKVLWHLKKLSSFEFLSIGTVKSIFFFCCPKVYSMYSRFMSYFWNQTWQLGTFKLTYWTYTVSGSLFYCIVVCAFSHHLLVWWYTNSIIKLGCFLPIAVALIKHNFAFIFKDIAWLLLFVLFTWKKKWI